MGMQGESLPAVPGGIERIPCPWCGKDFLSPLNISTGRQVGWWCLSCDRGFTPLGAPQQAPGEPQANPAPPPPPPAVPVDVHPSGLQAAVSGPGLVLVDLWAPWCGPCRFVAPILEEIAREWVGRVRVVKVNIDLDRSVLGPYGVTGIPTLLFFKDGQIAEVRTGARPKAEIEETIRRHL